MSHMAESIRGSLQRAFAAEQLPTDVLPSHILVHDSSREKVCQTVRQSGFCPITAKGRSEESWACTVVPYKTPSPFFDKDDLSALFSRCKYTGPVAPAGKSSWEGVNEARGYICGALNACISKIVEQYSQGDSPIVEIGSGIGYTLSPQTSFRIFQTQPDPYECSLLARENAQKEVYQMSVADLYKQLLPEGKRVPLFFALDVFDTMPPKQRAAAFSLISRLQSHGDRLIVMLDTNPEFTASLQEIESHYPDHTALPFFLSSRCAKIRCVLVPNHLLAASPLFSGKPSAAELAHVCDEDPRAQIQQKSCPRQEELRRLQKEHDLPVVILEDFYKERAMEELAKVGYACKDYYTASFILDKPVWPFQDPAAGLLVHKSVTDNFIVKSWRPNNPEFSQWLSSKGIQPPQFCDEELSHIRAKGLKILGAEILVVEATKQ